jgi:ABC-type multidrug transport system fused ATPase/permease subunit
MKFLGKLLRSYLPRIEPLGKWIPLFLILIVANAAMQSGISRVLGWLVDRVTANPKEFVHDWFVPGLAGLALLTLGYAIMEYTSKIFGSKIAIRAKAAYQRDLYIHLLSLDEAFYLRARAGDISSRLTKDIEEGVEPIYWNFTQLVWATMMIVFSVGILFSLHWFLGLAYLAFLPLWWIYVKYVMTRARKLDKEVREEFARLNSRATEDITNQALIRVFAKEGDRAAAFRHSAESYRDRSIRLNRFVQAVYSILNIALNFTLPLLILVICVTLLRGKLSPGEVLAAYGTWVASLAPIDMASRYLRQLATCRNALERVFEFFDETPEVLNAPDAQELHTSAGAIRLEQVQFRYPGADRPRVLHGVDMEIPGGTRCGLVGSSGSGKSTIAHLLMRFYDPTSGSVRVDGQDLRHVTQHSLRRQIGLVQQDSLIWAGTIRDNLLFVFPEADEAALWDALEKAELASFVRQTADGLDTLLGERGVRLSGGQRQRLALSRLFLLSPPIIVLDEATSALDGLAERAVQRSIDRLMATGRTMVVIAHRLSTIVDFKKIVVLEQGQIVAHGTHAELLETCPHYRDLCVKQGLQPGAS